MYFVFLKELHSRTIKLKSKMKKIILTFAAVCLIALTYSCRETEKKADDAADAVEEAMDDASEKLEEAGDAMIEAADDAGEIIEETTDDVIEEAGEVIKDGQE